MEIDQDNKRIKRVIDSTLIELAKIHDDHIDAKGISLPYNRDDLVEVRSILEEMSKDLEKIDKNITDVKLRVTSEVEISKFLDENNKAIDTLSSTFIGYQIDTLIEDLVDTEEDFYSMVTKSLFIINTICEIYLRKTSTTDINVDFKEVEKEYE